MSTYPDSEPYVRATHWSPLVGEERRFGMVFPHEGKYVTTVKALLHLNTVYGVEDGHWEFPRLGVREDTQVILRVELCEGAKRPMAKVTAWLVL